MSYTVIITEESAANVSVTDTSYPITIEYNATNIATSAYGNANVANFLANYGSNTVSTTGNVTAGYLLGNGSQLTGLPAGYANANAVAFGEAGWSGNIVPSANAVYSLGNVSRQWRDLYVSNTSVYIGNVPLSVTTGNTLTIGGQPLLSNNSSVSVSTTGNVSAAYFIGDGSQLTNLPLGGYSNSNVSAFLAAFGSNSISTTGNVTAGTFAGNGSALTSLPAANITGTVANATYALTANAATYATTAVQANVANVANSVAGANVSGAVANATFATTAGTVSTNAQPNITSVGILTAVNTSGAVSATGNVTGNFIIGDGSQLTNLPLGNYSNANVSAYLASGLNTANIVTSANVQGAYLIGNGSAITSVSGAAVTGTVANATYALNANAASFATDAVQANVANVANLVSGSNVSGAVANATYALNANAATYATDAVQANVANVANLVSGSNVSGAVANATYALTANAATYATDAVQANVANVANSVAGANVSGTVANATYALNSNAATFAGTVTTNAQPNITSVGNLTSVTVTGDAAIGGNLQVTGNVTYIASNVVTINDKFINVANNAATSSAANGGGIGVGPVGSEYATWAFSDANTAWQSNIKIEAPSVSVSGNVNASNVVGTWLWGDGSNITGVVAGAASTRIEVKNTSGGLLTKGTPVYATGVVGASTIVEIAASRADTVATMPCLGLLAQDLANNGQGYAITVGTLTSTNTNGYTTGQELYVAATGGLTASRPTGANTVQTVGIVGRVDSTNGSIEVNVWNVNSLPNLGNGNVWVGNATGFPTQQGQYGDANVAAYLPTYTGNLAAGNITATGVYYGNGSGLTTLTGANVTGTVANATYALNANAASFATSAEQANVANVANSVSGSNVSGTVGLAQYVTQNAQANITSVGTLSSLSVSGNVTVSGTTQLSNVQISNASQIVSNVAWTPDTASFGQAGRIIIGNGLNGSTGNAATNTNLPVWSSGRLMVSDSWTRSNTAHGTAVETVSAAITMTGNATQNPFRAQALNCQLVIGGGAAGNTINLGQTPGRPFGVSAGQFNINVGDPNGNIGVGNTTIGHLVTNGGVVQTFGNSQVGNMMGYYTLAIQNTASANINNIIGYALGGSAPANVPVISGNVYSFYHPSANSNQSMGAGISSYMRAAPNYYAFRNDDDVAQAKLGSLRFYHEYTHPLATSGTVNIDKNNAQVQSIEPTGNVTIGDFQNFVTSANDSVNIDLQTDTVKLIIRQGATPYSVILPTGNSKIQYVGNVSTVPATANSTSIVTIQASGNVGALADNYVVRVDSTVANSTVSVTGNVTGGNILTGGTVSATGNITGNYFIGNGSQLTGITASLSGNMVGNIAGQGYTISNLGHVAIANSGNISIGTVTITNNNVSPGTLNVSAQLEGTAFSASGNVTGNNIVATSFIRAASYTVANLTAITGAVGMMAAVSDQGGKFAYWDTTNTRWSYVHDNSAV